MPTRARTAGDSYEEKRPERKRYRTDQPGPGAYRDGREPGGEERLSKSLRRNERASYDCRNHEVGHVESQIGYRHCKTRERHDRSARPEATHGAHEQILL